MTSGDEHGNNGQVTDATTGASSSQEGAAPASAANLQLDAETGEMVSKTELKKVCSVFSRVPFHSLLTSF
jgi:hypothetical protein